MKIDTIEFTKLANKDLEIIVTYMIHELHDKNKAERFIKLLNNKIDLLKRTPFMYGVIEDSYFKKNGYRKFLVDEYIIFYHIHHRSIWILRILYAKKNWINIV